MRKPLAIIGMSPGNSYFKDYEVRYLLQEAIARFGRCAIMVADVPAVATYLAFGYSPAKARNKAIPKGNNLKNRTRRIAEGLGLSADQVRIVDWAEEVQNDPRYREHYKAIDNKYRTLPKFADAVRQTTRGVLDNHTEEKSPSEVEGATHYLLSEIAFLEFAPEFFDEDRICYLYHREWKVYEDYIQGKFDGVPKEHLDFLLLEAPYETYVKLVEAIGEEDAIIHDTYSRVMQSGILRAAYSDYPPALQKQNDIFSGIFFEVIDAFALRHGLRIDWVEETGYGVVINGLSECRYDIFCAATWPTPERQRKAGLSLPLYYSDVGVWVRSDSLYAKGDWTDLNNGGRIAITENDITHDICLTDFVRAKWIRIPQMAQVRGLLDAVAEGRADATIAERLTVESYMPGLAWPLVNIAADRPIRRYPNCFLVGKDQNDFLDVLDAHIRDMLRRGEIEPLLKKHVGDLEGVYLPKLHENTAMVSAEEERVLLHDLSQDLPRAADG